MCEVACEETIRKLKTVIMDQSVVLSCEDFQNQYRVVAYSSLLVQTLGTLIMNQITISAGNVSVLTLLASKGITPSL